MDRFRTGIDHLLAQRNSSDRRVRAAWWLGLICLLGITIAPPLLLILLVSIWTAINMVYVGAAFLWSLFHPRAGWRALLRASNVGIGWAVWLTLAVALLLFSVLFSLASRTTDLPARVASHPIGFLFILLLVLCPIIFTFLTLYALTGLAIGAFLSRHSGQIERGARTGGSVWMWLTLGMVTLSVLLARHPAPWQRSLALVYTGLPLITAAICGRMLQSPLDRRLRSPDAPSFSERWFVLRWVYRGKTRRQDLRGALLGLIAAAIMLLMPRTVIAPLQTLALSSLIQLRSIVMLDSEQDQKLLAGRDRIVLLDMDSLARYQALHDGSESAVQADIVSRLWKLGAQRIVLPQPLLDASHLKGLTSSGGFAMPGETDVARSVHDLPMLVQAALQAHDMILMKPSYNSGLHFDFFDINGSNPPKLTLTLQNERQRNLDSLALEQAALAVSNDTLSDTGASYLPTVPLHRRGGLPVPLLLTDGLDKAVRPAPGPAPSLQDDEIVNFNGIGPDHDFAHIPYSNVKHNDPIFLVAMKPDPSKGIQHHTTHWVRPSDLVRGRIVFLDSLARPQVMTPGGMMTREEELAYATSTLLSHQPLQRFYTPLSVFLTLLLGLLVGASCFKREPLEALWRVVLAILIIAIVSLYVYIAFGSWLDPIVPLMAVIAALTLVTQFTFTQERSEKERERAQKERERAERERTRALFQRFVAANKVEEMLNMPEEALKLGGKRQTVCVLFADVRNFTHFAEFHDAEKVIEVTNKYMGALTEALHRYDGILDKYTGDGLMAWFPIGADAKSDLARAVKAAVAMRDAAIEVSAQMLPEERLEIGIGLHYGDAVVGLVGCEDLQVNWTALGYTVVVSARLQTIAAGGEVVISEQVANAISDAFQIVPGEPVMVKGVSAPVHPYRVVGPKPAGLLPAPPPTPQNPAPVEG